MKFRLKMTLCMLWLLALVFGAGGGALITLSLRTALLQAESASLENYSANLRALQLVTASSMQKDIPSAPPCAAWRVSRIGPASACAPGRRRSCRTAAPSS